MKKFLSAALVAAFLLPLIPTSLRAQFTPGNVAVLRTGSGSEGLVNTGNSLFVDQYTTNGLLVNTVTIPNTYPTGLILSGVAGTEGGLTRSLDRTVLVFTGYNTNRASTAGSLGSTTGAAVTRGYAVIDAAENYTFKQARPDIFSANNPRCAATDGTNNFWLAGGSSGTLYLQPPSGGPVTVQSSIANTRYVKAVNGTVYFTTQASSTAGLWSLGGLPNAATTPAQIIATGSSSSPCQFAINLDGTVIYIGDQRATTSGGGIQKWVNNGTGWTNIYTLTNNLGTNGPFGLTADFSGTSTVLFATSVDASTNRLVSLVDTNANAVGTIIARAPANTLFKGVDLVPDLRPVITSQPKSQSVLSGSSTTLSVGAESVSAVNFQWQHAGTNLPNATISTLGLTSITSAVGGAYRVIVGNPAGSITSVVATLTVTVVASAPVITTQPLNQTNYAGADIIFTSAASGTDPLAYQWQFNSGDITGATNASLVLTNLELSQTGNYRVVVTNSAGSTNSQPAHLLVRPVPPTVTNQPGSQTVLSGTTVSFEVAATGTAPLTYQWTFNNANIADGGDYKGTTTSTLTISNTKLEAGGLYYVKIANDGGTTNSAPALLTVLERAPSTVIPYATPGQVYTQNFDSLPAAGDVSVNANNPVTVGAVTFGLNNPFDFGFPIISSASLGGLGLSNTMSGWYGLGVLTSKFGASLGDQSTGGIISFGPTNNAATNRALGLISTSSTGPTAFGVKFVNTSGTNLSLITLHFTGELWRQQPTAKTLSLGYLIDPVATNQFSTNVTDWLNALDVNFPTNAFAVLDGTAATNQLSLGLTNLSIPNWAPGSAFWLVWQMTNAAGSSQGLAIDNFSFSANPIPQVSLSIQSTAGNVVLAWPSSALGYQLQQSTNLAWAGGWVISTNTVITSGANNTVTVPTGTGAIYYRLAQ